MESEPSILGLASLLIGLVAASAFFSASETAMMAVNRYRLKYLIESGNRSAMRVEKLLERPDRLLGLILLGNNLVNMAAASVATVLALRLHGESAIAIATLAVTILVLIIAEIPPKTFAALHPEKIALAASGPLQFLQRMANPIISIVNLCGNFLLKLLGVKADNQRDSLTIDELRIAVSDSGAHLPPRYMNMLLRLLDMSNLTVEDVMLPRQEIEAIDMDDEIQEIVTQMRNSGHPGLPLYRESLDNVIGVIDVRRFLDTLYRGAEVTNETLTDVAQDAYFVPESTGVTEQIRAFKHKGEHLALVVDEYGTVQGLLTMSQIINEVLGDQEEDLLPHDRDIREDADGESLLIDASITVRDFNRSLGFDFPTDGPKTLNGLILEVLEDIPQNNDQIVIYEVPFTIASADSVQVELVRLAKLALTSRL